MENEFEPGELVRLKSGGPTMTVLKKREVQGVDMAQCGWFEPVGPMLTVDVPCSALDSVDQ